MGGRDERRELLRQSKGFTCMCGRCVGPDREAALPCLSCAPLAQRPQGFMAPAAPVHTHNAHSSVIGERRPTKASRSTSIIYGWRRFAAGEAGFSQLTSRCPTWHITVTIVWRAVSRVIDGLSSSLLTLTSVAGGKLVTVCGYGRGACDDVAGDGAGHVDVR